MLKRVLSIALFLTLILSLAPLASAAEGDPQVKVDYVAIANHDPSDNAAISISPPNARVGLLYPGLADNTLTIKGKHDVMISRAFDILVVFDGVLDTAEGESWLWVNHKKVDLTNSTQYLIAEDGKSWSAIVINYAMIDNDPTFFVDWGSSRTYRIDIAQDLGTKVKSDYSFTVKYVDEAPIKEEDLVGNVSTEMMAEINLIQMGFTYTVVDNYNTDVVVEDGDVVVGIVNASILNLRSGPGTGNSIIGKLPKGTGVGIVEVSDKWFGVVTEDGAIGYVWAGYITIVE